MSVRPTKRLATTGRTGVLSALLSGVFLGLLVAVLAISFAAIVYVGPLEPFAERGASLALLGAAVTAAIGAVTLSYRGTVCGPQDISAVTLSVATAGIAAAWAGGPDEGLFATVATTVALTTAVTGLAFLLVGSFRLGNLARYIPYPVIGGFLAATGLLLVLGAIAIATGRTVTLLNLPAVLASADPALWAPAVVLALALFAAVRLTGKTAVLSLLLAAGFAGFYAVLWLLDMPLAEARDRGFLLGSSDPAGLSGGIAPFTPGLVLAADGWLILMQAPAILAVVALSAIGMALSAAGIEHATGSDLGLNREFAGTGFMNLGAALAGGLPGYHYLGATALAHFLGVRTRVAGLMAALVCAAAFLLGERLLSAVPLCVLGGLSGFIGLNLLYDWVVVNGRRLPASEFAVVLAILAVSAVFGFVEGVATGLVACVVLFVVISARQDVVLKRFTTANRQSPVDRGPEAHRLFKVYGGRNVMFELDGHLFFGTAHRLFRNVSAALDGAGEPVLCVVLDFRRVQSIDSSAAHSFDRIRARCARAGAGLVVTDLAPPFARRLGLQRAETAGRIKVCQTLDEGMELAEERLLAALASEDRVVPSAAFEALLAGPAAAYFTPRRLAAGTPLVRFGEPSAALFLVVTGRLSVSMPATGGGALRLRTIGPGALVGEIGLYADRPRTATVTADTAATVLTLSSAELARMESEAPALAISLHKLVAAYLAMRLVENTTLFDHARR